MVVREAQGYDQEIPFLEVRPFIAMNSHEDVQ